MRYAGYVRISSEDQVGNFSIDAQTHTIQNWVKGQGATLVAAIWGVLIWKEFQAAPRGTTPFIVLMFLGYISGLTLIGVATLS